MTKNNDISSYTIEDITTALQIEYQECTINKSPELDPKAYILGGQGGAGKSTLQEMFVEFHSNTICINGDEYRKYHPRFKEIQSEYGNEAANYTQSFANAVTNALVEELTFEGYNIVIEGTCRRADVPLKTCKDLKEKGYEVELSVMCTDHNVAWQSTIDRYNTMKEKGLIPRAVPRDKYEETVNALPDNIEALYLSNEFDEITLYNRDRECLYRMTEPPENAIGQVILNPRDILYGELHSSDLVLKSPIVQYDFDIGEEILIDSFYKYARFMAEPEMVSMDFETEHIATQLINDGHNPFDVYKKLKKGYEFDIYGNEYVSMVKGKEAQKIAERHFHPLIDLTDEDELGLSR